MEFFDLSQMANTIHINTFPDAVKVLKIKNRSSRQLADLMLHRQDLEFSLHCLEEIQHFPEDKYILRQGLWRSAIVHFGKCFGDNKSRSQLNADKIFKNSPIAQNTYKYFKALRNKHIVHDDNSYTQCIPGAIINNGKKSYKIEKIVCLSVLSETLDKTNYNNLYSLITESLSWVIKSFDQICTNLTSELEQIPYLELLSGEQIKFQVPDVKDVHITRPQN